MKLLYLADANRNHTKSVIQYFYDKGYDVELISHSPLNEFDIKVHLINNCRNKNGGLKKFWYLEQIGRIRAIIDKVQPDILHALNITDFGVLGAFSNFHPFVVTAFGPDIFHYPRKNPVYNSLIRFCLRRVDLLNGSAPHIAAKIKKMKFKKSKILAYDFFLDISDKTEFEPPGASRSHCYTVLSTVNWESHTNLKTLLQTIPKVVQENKKVWFILLCNEWTQARLAPIVKKLRISENVAFPPLNNQKDVEQYYQLADIYISLALSDGMPQALFKAMKYGAFPIMSEIPAYQEWIEDGENGLLVKPKNSNEIARTILTAIRNQDVCERAAQINQEKISLLPSIEKNLEQLEYHYFDLSKKMGK